jgi:hypothetical protein
MKGRDHCEDLDMEGRIILDWILDITDDGVDYMQLADDVDKWWAVANTVNFQVG